MNIIPLSKKYFYSYLIFSSLKVNFMGINYFGTLPLKIYSYDGKLCLVTHNLGWQS